MKLKKKIPCNMWAVLVEVRKQGAIGKFEEQWFVIRAEPRDITRFVLEDIETAGLEPRAILSAARISRDQSEWPVD